MARQPDKAEYKIGADQHQRPLTLTREGDLWTIRRAAINQRDESVMVDGLTTEHLRVIAQIVTDAD